MNDLEQRNKWKTMRVQQTGHTSNSFWKVFVAFIFTRTVLFKMRNSCVCTQAARAAFYLSLSHLRAFHTAPKQGKCLLENTFSLWLTRISTVHFLAVRCEVILFGYKEEKNFLVWTNNFNFQKFGLQTV